MNRRHPLADCENCPLNTPDYKPVLSTGNPDPDVVFIGEAPGKQEMLQGSPFVGQSGKLLHTLIGLEPELKANTENFLFTNTILCNDKTGTTKPPQGAVEACKPRLQAECEPAHTLVPMGAFAASAVSAEKRVKITSKRVGQPQTTPPDHDYPNKRVVYTVHPAAVLRNPDMVRDLTADLAKVPHSVQVVYEPPTYTSYDHPDDVQKTLTQLQRYPMDLCVIDIETGVEKDDVFMHPSSLLCVGIGYQRGKAVVLGGDAFNHTQTKHLFQQLLKAKKVIAHNAKFDMQVLYNLNIIPEIDFDFDTMLASYAIDERPGHGLKYLGKELLGTPDWDAEVKQYLPKKNSSFANIPKEVLYRYNAYDIATTTDLYYLLDQALKNKKLTPLHDMLVRFSKSLAYVESNGISFDMGYNKQLHTKYEEQLEELEETLKPWIENPRSPMQVHKALANLDTELPDTTEQTLTVTQQTTKSPEVRNFLIQLLKYRKVQKYYSVYIKGYRDKTIDNKLWPTFLVHGTTTGRLSCRNPNLQNAPRSPEIRNQIIASPGRTLIQADFSTLELRVFCCYAQDESLRNIFNEGRDVNNEISDRIYGPGNWTKEDRVKAKSAVYGVCYGRQAEAVAEEFDISRNEAQKMMDTFNKMVPGITEAKKAIKHQVLVKQEPISTVFGRRRRFGLITKQTKHNIEREAYAFLPQSTASDICMTALCELVEKGIDVRLPVHDSILIEVDDDQVTEGSKLLQETMEGAARDTFDGYIPYPAEPEYSKRWGEL